MQPRPIPVAAVVGGIQQNCIKSLCCHTAVIRPLSQDQLEAWLPIIARADVFVVHSVGFISVYLLAQENIGQDSSQSQLGLPR